MTIDWIFIVFCTIITFSSYYKILFKKECSIGYYIIIVIYIFMVIPIIFNYSYGLPMYVNMIWYSPFIKPMKNYNVNIIYDIYVLFTIILIYLYSLKISKKILKGFGKENNSYLSLIDNKLIAFILIVSPVILIILKGNVSNYLEYNIASKRGLYDGNYFTATTPYMILSMLVFFAKYYREKVNFKIILLTLLYGFILVWISGKRFMIANLLMMLILYITNLNLKKSTRKKLFYTMPLLLIFMLFFSIFYLTQIRPLATNTTQNLYDCLRIDFGRDDVTKYAICEKIILKHTILDYPGQSFLSILLFFVPRSIWHNKPYAHYLYLTSSVFNVPIKSLDFGITPSLFEMSIFNFGWFGFLFTPLLLIVLCYCCDKNKSIDVKAIWLLFIIVMLTQSMSSYIIIIMLLLFIFCLKFILKNKKIKFVWRNGA